MNGAISRLDRWLLDRLIEAVGEAPVEVVLWTGETIRLADVEPVARVHLRDRGAFRRLVRDPSFRFGEEYAAGGMVIEGGLVELLRHLLSFSLRNRVSQGLQSRLSTWFRRPRGTSLTASKKNIHRHYDVGNDFYKLWLDERMVYTCAYFTDPSNTLEQAQLDKLDHVCRKVMLQPGQHVIEAGCGWGALAMHMARQYGVTVIAYNISHEQVVYARDRARAEGLAGRVEFVEDDWRNITGTCDAFVSVGMLEHVGLANYERLGRVLRGCLREDGFGLIHSIGRNYPLAGDSWIERRIFPGGYAPSLGEMLRVFEPNDFSVLDVENIRMHYAKTLSHWLLRFEEATDVVRDMFDEEFLRVWRLYLASSQ
ncbi:MAG: class I SAM-dependent methyltransferase, partial [Planctomycetaceae bacterium]